MWCRRDTPHTVTGWQRQGVKTLQGYSSMSYQRADNFHTNLLLVDEMVFVISGIVVSGDGGIAVSGGGDGGIVVSGGDGIVVSGDGGVMMVSGGQMEPLS